MTFHGLTPLLLMSHVQLYPWIGVLHPSPMKYIKVSIQWPFLSEIPHTLDYVYTYTLCTWYKMINHLSLFWIKFKRDKNGKTVFLLMKIAGKDIWECNMIFWLLCLDTPVSCLLHIHLMRHWCTIRPRKKSCVALSDRPISKI